LPRKEILEWGNCKIQVKELQNEDVKGTVGKGRNGLGIRGEI